MIRRRVANRASEGIIHFCSALMSVCTVLCPDLGLPVQEGCGAVEEDPEEVTVMIKGLEQLSYEERLRELGLFSLLNRRRLQEYLTAVTSI